MNKTRRLAEWKEWKNTKKGHVVKNGFGAWVCNYTYTGVRFHTRYFDTRQEAISFFNKKRGDR